MPLQLVPNPDGGGEAALPPAGTLQKSNVALLKELLGNLRLDNAGTKPVLLARLAQEDGRRRDAEKARQQLLQQQQAGQQGNAFANGLPGQGGQGGYPGAGGGFGRGNGGFGGGG